MGAAALLSAFAFSCPVLVDFPADSPSCRLARGDRITVALFRLTGIVGRHSCRGCAQHRRKFELIWITHDLCFK